jgi:hypothetical protein
MCIVPALNHSCSIITCRVARCDGLGSVHCRIKSEFKQKTVYIDINFHNNDNNDNINRYLFLKNC